VFGLAGHLVRRYLGGESEPLEAEFKPGTSIQELLQPQPAYGQGKNLDRKEPCGGRGRQAKHE